MKYRNMIVWLSTFALILTGCFSRATRPDVQDTLVIFPPPPDTTRIQFLTRFSSALDVQGKPSGFKRYVIGSEENKEIIKPYGVAIHDGKIYVCDTMLGGMEIIDLEKRTFNYFKPGGYGLLKKPINCFVDSEGNLYVADAKRRQVVVFGPDLKFKASIGEPTNSKPTDVFVYGDYIFVTDLTSHQVEVYSKNTFELVRTFPDAPADSPAFLRQPTNLYVIEDRVYVSDFGAFNVKVYTLEGEFLQAIGSYGRGLGQFVRPKGIAVDRNLNLFVVDAGFENVQIFDRNGRLLMFFGGDYKGPGYMWLPAKVVIDYDNLEYFKKYVHEGFDLKYLILVTNQYGPDKISVYGFVGPERKVRELTIKQN